MERPDLIKYPEQGPGKHCCILFIKKMARKQIVARARIFKIPAQINAKNGRECYSYLPGAESL